MKALALGADCVLVGRPYIYGLATGGQDGVEKVLTHLLHEFDISMALAGICSIDEIEASVLVRNLECSSYKKSWNWKWFKETFINNVYFMDAN